MGEQKSVGIESLTEYASIARVASDLAHSLNNVLAICRGNAVCLQDLVPADGIPMIADILRSLEDLEALAADLQVLSGIEEGLCDIDLNAWLVENLSRVQARLGADVVLRISLPAVSPRVRVDPSLLRRAIGAIIRAGLGRGWREEELVITADIVSRSMPDGLERRMASIAIPVPADQEDTASDTGDGPVLPDGRGQFFMGTWFADSVARACGGALVSSGATTECPDGHLSLMLPLQEDTTW